MRLPGKTAIVTAFCLALAGGAMAADIDTTGTLADIAGPFGFPETQTIGQTFTPDADQTHLIGFTMYLRDPGQTGSLTGNSLQFQGYIASWNAAQGRADSILFSSTVRTEPASGAPRAFTFTPTLTLTPGQTYVAFLSSVGIGAQLESAFGMPLNGNIIAGHFVYQNEPDVAALTAQPWVTGDYPFNDAWLQVRFGSPTPTPTPAPAGLGLLGLALAGLALSRRARKAG
jgi:MYXO-CTERM domain-containing protein